MAAIKINADPGTEMHAAISKLLKDRRKVSPAEWSARCAELLKAHGKSLWR